MTTNEYSLSIELSPTLWEQLKRYQTQKGTTHTISDVVLEVLQEFFATKSDSSYASSDRLEALEARVNGLAQQVMRLNQQFIQPSMQPTPPVSSSTHPYHSNQPFTYEEIEDEPDEVLLDFLPPQTPRNLD
jgi:hypothetical protein